MESLKRGIGYGWVTYGLQTLGLVGPRPHRHRCAYHVPDNSIHSQICNDDVIDSNLNK